MAKIVINDLINIFKGAVSAVLPGNLIRNSLKYNPELQSLTILDDNYDLKNRNVYVVGTGKAVLCMAKEVEQILGTKVKNGIVSIPTGILQTNTKSFKLQYFEGAANNLPDGNAESTARKINDLVFNLDKTDLLLVLISGGGSALLPLPKPPITLQEKTELIKVLANAGADIKELNTVRKKLSDVKGGKLAINAQPAQVISLILSDIVGDPLDMIASGPTTENKDKPEDAYNVISKFNLLNYIPSSIKKRLKETNRIEVFPHDNVKNYIIGSNKLAMNAALEQAQNLKYFTNIYSGAITGTVNDVAIKYACYCKIYCELIAGKIGFDAAKQKLASLNIPGVANIPNVSFNKKDSCCIFGGEITVEVKGSGKGGRNQHLALEFSKILHYMKKDFNDFNIYFLSAGTDGIDGPTDAAGAIGYLDLLEDSKHEGLDVEDYLDKNDTYNFYKKFKNGRLHVITGHTNTNVMDLHIIIITMR